MSEKYIPLYRKYRPQTFHDLIGQDHIKKALSNAIDLGRISHAYLFCGPRGTGKTSSARILAKSLNCQEGPTLSPCGKCPSCVDIANSTPMDVIEIDAASNRGVDDTQKIIEKIHYVPVHGRYKIYVIDEVHQLSPTSFNALLKTLEEPPENVVFILATTEPHKVLETVISRCQRFDFKRITVNDIVARLRYISEKENIKIDDDALLAIAQNSAGGMRDSLSLLDQVSILDVQKTITVDDIEALLGKISNDVLFQITELILEHKTPECIKLIGEIYDKGNEPTQILTNLIQYLRNVLILKTFTDRDAVRNLTQLSDDYLKKMSTQAQLASENNFIFIIEKLNEYIKEIKLSSNPYMWLELCFMDLTTINFDSYENILSRLEQLENGNVSAITSKQPEQVLSIKQTVAPTPKEVKEEKEVKQTEKRFEKPAISSNEINTQIEQVQPEPTVQKQSQVSGDSSVWDQIISNIDHTPSKVLFSSKGLPIELSEEKVLIVIIVILHNFWDK